ncbi:thioesterase family protein [Dyadobacter sp. SG02]|uniref:acyl-CoA thioesterase n=1 Tax=Dyadobacter sp. SG02 TaxID=1855291 RepID=UPI000B854B1B|nr:acyl-CoA thioesterase [Dyadobacter sp. SG02]
MEKILCSTYKIRFQDCDPFNHLNNASYINYFLNAREDHLQDRYQFDVFERVKTDGEAWVVVSNQICYLSSAYAIEKVLIESQLIAFTGKSLRVEMRMWNNTRDKLKAVLWTDFLYINIRTQKTIHHPEALAKLLGDMLLPVEQTVFEERRNYFMRRTGV